MKVTVVLKHSGIENSGHSDTVKFIEVLSCLERRRNLNGTVAAEVIKYYAVTVVYGSDGLTVLRDNEGGEVLIDNAGFRTVGLDCLLRGREESSLSENVGVPAVLYHLPVSLVSVHRNLHSSAARCDFCIEAVGIYRSKIALEEENVVKCARFSNVASVKKYMKPYPLNTSSACRINECTEMVYVRVYVSIRKKSYKVKRRIVFDYVTNYLAPSCRCEKLTRFNRL